MSRSGARVNDRATVCHDRTSARIRSLARASAALARASAAEELAMSADALSEVLRAVRLQGAVFYDVHVTAPWVSAAPPAQVVAPKVMPGAEHVIEYHVITSGRCWGNIEGEEPVRLETGDVVVFPQGDAHVLS